MQHILHNGRSLTPFDRCALFLLASFGVIALIALLLVPRYFLPAEDAVILFQYSRNLAGHGAVTFFTGGPHVEGATDFAWMSLIAAAIRYGLPPFWCCAIANVFSLAILAVLLLKLAGLRPSPSRLLTIAGAACLCPQIFAAAAGFAVLPDAALLTLLVLCVTKHRSGLATLSALVFCLFRPDGVILASPLLLHLFTSRRDRGRNALLVCSLFIVPGGFYFFWRWHYFGEFWPLPFLVKSDTARVLGLFVRRSVRTSLIFLAFVAIALAPLKLLKTVCNPSILMALVLVPTAFYWTMRLDQNVGSRFFYYLPLTVAIMLALNWSSLQTQRVVVFRTVAAAWLLLFAMPFFRELRTFRDEQFREVKSIAEALARMPQHGTILTSEAGFLPYYSDWTTYDAWGLNTPEFAHRFFQASDVKRLNPDLIVLHPDRSESCVMRSDWQQNYTSRTWPHLTRNLVEGAYTGQYELWLTSYGSDYYRLRKHWNYGEGDRECWLVQNTSPFHDTLAKILQEHHGVAPAEALVIENRRRQTAR